MEADATTFSISTTQKGEKDKQTSIDKETGWQKQVK